MKLRHLVFGALAALVLAGCAGAPAAAPAAPKASSQAVPGAEQILPYVHIDGFGTETDEVGWLAWEFEALDFVKYQIAYTSCTCRPESINKRSLLYVEVSKGGTGGKIRRVWFDYWGDSPVMPAGSTREEIERQWMPQLPNKKLETIPAIDTMAGATVTTVNLKQILKALLVYHNAKYPSPGMPEAPDFADATSGASS